MEIDQAKVNQLSVTQLFWDILRTKFLPSTFYKKLLPASGKLYGYTGYENQPVPAELEHKFGVVDLIGPTGLVRSHDLRLGFVVIDSETCYPAHAHPHPATEIYYILYGSAEWQTGDEQWKNVSKGDFKLHSSETPHAIKIGTKPLLALYSRRGDVDTPSLVLESQNRRIIWRAFFLSLLLRFLYS